MEYSVIIRTKNSAKTVKECLDSIFNQTILPEKVIIVDAGSTDDTLKIVEEFKVQIISYPQDLEFNYSKALNIGISETNSRNILILSSHVKFLSVRNVEMMISLLVRNKKCIGISTLRSSHEKSLKGDNFRIIYNKISKETFAGRAMYNFCSLIRRKNWQDYVFNENIPRCEDQDWAFHFLERNYYTLVISEPQVYYYNPYYNPQKDAWDYIILGQKIYPYFLSNSFLKRMFFKSFSQFKSGQKTLAKYNLNILRILIKHKFLFSEDVKSVYNEKLN